MTLVQEQTEAGQESSNASLAVCQFHGGTSQQTLLYRTGAHAVVPGATAGTDRMGDTLWGRDLRTDLGRCSANHIVRRLASLGEHIVS
jgi:hypothetical protein